MSWNIAKPGDQINGPVSITGALTSSSTISGTQIISTVATGTAPLTVASTTNVTNLNADLLDGQQGSYYQSADNINAGTLVVGRGGTGASTFTAGRVLFGNGTSALNTSANLFWDNSNNRLGIGTASPLVNLDVRDTNGTIVVSNSATRFGFIQWENTGSELRLGTDGNFGVRVDCATLRRFSIASDGVCTWSNVVNAGTAMTLNGTGLGVGVSPNTILHVRKDFAGYTTIKAENQHTIAAGTGISFTINDGGTDASWFRRHRDGTGNTDIGYNAALRFRGQVTATERTDMLIDTSGNVGLGVTPSAHSAGRTAFQSPAGVIEGAAGELNILNNAFLASGGWTKINNAAATMFRSTGAEFKWYNAAAGTGVFTWTQAMTLDSSGKLGIGSTPSTNLSIGSGSGSGGYGGGVYLNRGGSSYNFYEAGDGTNTVIFGLDHTLSYAKIGSINSYPISLITGNSVRLTVKATGQINFVGLASDPAGAAAGDVYYNTTTNKLKCYNGTTWNDLF